MNVMIQSRWIGALALLIWDQCHGDETFVETGTFRHHPDIEIELFVAEPHVIAPVARPVAVNLLLRRRAWHLPMIEAVEQGRIGPGELNLDLEQRRRLRRHSSEAVQVRARAMFGDEEYSNRAAFLNDWMKDLPAEGKRD